MTLFQSLIAATMLSLAHSMGQPRAPGTRYADHVVILGVDGMGSHFLEPFMARGPEYAPNIQRMKREGFYTHNARSVFPSISAPNWVAMLRSATPSESGVGNNFWDPTDAHVPDINTRPDGKCATTPDIFNVLRVQKPDATTGLFVGWKKFAPHLPGPERFRNVTVTGLHDMELAIRAGEYFKINKPEFMFLQLDEVDEMGHAKGYGPYYDRQVNNADTAIGRFLDAIEDSGRKERTLVFLVSDHGRTDSGFMHGDFKINQLQTTLILWGGGFSQSRVGKEIFTPVLNVDVPATAVFALGYDQPIQWRGRPIKEAFLEDGKYGWYLEQEAQDIPEYCVNWKVNTGEFIIPSSYVLGAWNAAFIMFAAWLIVVSVVFTVCRCRKIRTMFRENSRENSEAGKVWQEDSYGTTEPFRASNCACMAHLRCICAQPARASRSNVPPPSSTNQTDHGHVTSSHMEHARTLLAPSSLHRAASITSSGEVPEKEESANESMPLWVVPTTGLVEGKPAAGGGKRSRVCTWFGHVTSTKNGQMGLLAGFWVAVGATAGTMLGLAVPWLVVAIQS
eukprot:comp7030_c0_seq1/m.2763 comp7030_c0_seq1/g.2763  ORF comp7030_c0_seq1/g.2763 comp7030_c0_seq1/m.2763 type:complete len:564 (-) comp7030_c0_seq1:145-1836(-)